MMIFLLTIAIGFWVYAFDRYNPESGLYFDGFGRKLYKAPAIFGSDLTPGLVWELIDTGIAIIVVGIAMVLFSFGTKLKKQSWGPETSVRSWVDPALLIKSA